MQNPYENCTQAQQKKQQKKKQRTSSKVLIHQTEYAELHAIFALGHDCTEQKIRFKR